MKNKEGLDEKKEITWTLVMMFFFFGLILFCEYFYRVNYDPQFFKLYPGHKFYTPIMSIVFFIISGILGILRFMKRNSRGGNIQ